MCSPLSSFFSSSESILFLVKSRCDVFLVFQNACENSEEEELVKREKTKRTHRKSEKKTAHTHSLIKCKTQNDAKEETPK